jgi:hypothetical protein
MRTFVVGFALTCPAISAMLTADEPNSSPPKGVVIDYRGPPEGGNFTLVRRIYLEGIMIPTQDTITFSAFQSRLTAGEQYSMKLKGFIVRKVGQTQLEVTCWKGKEGKVIPVRRITFKSPHLSPEQLPKVHNPMPLAF